MSCSYLFSGKTFTTVRWRRDASLRQRQLFPPPLALRQPSSSLALSSGLIASANDGISKPSLETRNRFPSSFIEDTSNIGNGCNGNDNNGNGDGGGSWWHNGDGDNSDGSSFPSLRFIFLLSFVLSFFHFRLSSAIAIARAPSTDSNEENEKETIWEVKRSKWIQLFPDFVRDEFISATSSFELASSLSLENLLTQCRKLLTHFLLPEGFPKSVTSDYLDYTIWRGVQGVASQISAVLATQSLLYAVGLGKGAIPTAAAINWVLKDGIGYLSKIMLSKYGRHFDVHPKGWRLFADLLENAAFGMEMLTPVFPQLFVVIGAAAGAGRSAAALIQAATRSCFHAGFAAQRNFAEVIAKGEAQGMVSKSIGIMLGIALANCIGTSTGLALASFGIVTCIHMYTNLKSYQCIQIRTLNPYRASLVFSEYLLSGQAPSIKDVNDEEPLFAAVPILNIKSPDKSNYSSTILRTSQPELVSLSPEAKAAAAEIEQRLQLGSKLSDLIHNKEEALALFDLYRDEGYILTEHRGKFCVALKESSSPKDMLKSLFQVNFLYWLEKNAGIAASNTRSDCKPGGRLYMSLDYVRREFEHVKYDSESIGWVADGLIARPLPNRIRPGYFPSLTPTS